MIPFLVALLLVAGCSNPDAHPTTVHGAWIGTGEFRAGQGKLDVRAQLEVLPNGRYRFLVLEPGLLAAVGAEIGDWTRNGNTLDLAPDEETHDPNRRGLLGSAPRNFRPKSLSVVGEVKSLELNDGPMTITFKPNPKATAKLREAGEL
jgi:hypothetical protein